MDGDNKLVLGNKDFLAGLVFLAFGLAAMHIADRDYPMGTLVRMGPGDFPAALGLILALFGVYLAARGLGWPRKDEAPVAWDWRPVGCIVASMFLFGFLLPRLGLMSALAAMFVVAALGGREFRWREVLALTAVMTAFAVGVFVYLLKLPFQLAPGIWLV
ncbi:MAG TPA: tripartite tricarboxylate transporter TctB family protein [Burkholderiales bacterium]|jgi:putative tricarboxylic transport membrane protein|nr:tripartite tricarboxylate transporter TctB family protein [Burkholderiales bacterium]